MKPTHYYHLNQNTSRYQPFSHTPRQYSHTIQKTFKVPVEYIGPSKTKGWVVILLPNNLTKHVKEDKIEVIV